MVKNTIKLKCFGTGSDGNGYLLQFNNNDHILIEAGVNYLNYRTQIKWNKIKSICISHEHIDHIKYLPTIYEMFPNINLSLSLGSMKYMLENSQIFKMRTFLNKEFQENMNKLEKAKEDYKHISFLPVHNTNTTSLMLVKGFTHHDTLKPEWMHFRYTQNKQTKNVIFITDTGKIPSAFKHTKFIEPVLFLIESNYDNAIINKSLHLAHNHRTKSDLGHLSTKQAYEFIEYQGPMHTYYLIHGSKNNLDSNSDDIYKSLTSKGYNITRLKNDTEIIW